MSITPPIENAPDNLQLLLSPSEVRELYMWISDEILQDGWFELEDDEFTFWTGLLRRLGYDPATWLDRRAQMDAD